MKISGDYIGTGVKAIYHQGRAALKTRVRTLLLMLCDAAIINLAMIIPFGLRFYEDGSIDRYLSSYISFAPWVTITFIAIFFLFKLYNRIWAYASTGELFALIQAVTLGSLAAIAISYFAQSQLPRSIAVMHWAFAILLMGGSRLLWRYTVEHMKAGGHKPSRRALIIGAGDGGAMVARELKGNSSSFLPVGFIDDDPMKRNAAVLGLPVLGPREKIPEVVARRNVDLIIMAMPSVGASVIRDIVDICRSTKAELKILPGVYQIIDGQVSVNHLRPVQLEDLLHREPVRADLQEIAGYLGGHTVLVTGAGGSIGSELCRQVAVAGPKKLVLLGTTKTASTISGWSCVKNTQA